MGQSFMTWSEVCSGAPQSQAAEDANPHLCMSERNRPTPVRRWFRFTHARRGKVKAFRQQPTSGMNERSLVKLDSHSFFQVSSAQNSKIAEVMASCSNAGSWALAGFKSPRPLHIKDKELGMEQVVWLPYGLANKFDCSIFAA